VRTGTAMRPEISIGGHLRALGIILAGVAIFPDATRADDNGLAQADFGNYRYFAWLMEPPLLTGDAAGPPRELHPNALDSAELDRVRTAIEDELSSKGYLRLDTNPDFLILLTVGSRQIVDAPIYAGHRDTWGLRSHYAGIDSDRNGYTSGILSIDIFDRRLHEPVWHQRSAEPITGSAVQDRDSTIDRVVSSLLDEFPRRVRSLSHPLEIGFTYAEGYTSNTPQSPIRLGFRAFTLFSTPCNGLPKTEILVAEPERIVLKVGERFFMPQIILRAFDQTGNFTADAPLVAGMHYASNVLTFESDNDKNFWAVAVGEGEGRAVFSAGCGEQGDWPSLRVEIPILVVDH